MTKNNVAIAEGWSLPNRYNRSVGHYTPVTDESEGYECSMVLDEYLLHDDDDPEYYYTVTSGKFTFRYDNRYNVTAEIYFCPCNGRSIRIQEVSPTSKLLTNNSLEVLMAAADAAQSKGLIVVKEVPVAWRQLDPQWREEVLTNNPEDKFTVPWAADREEFRKLHVIDTSKVVEHVDGTCTTYSGAIKRDLPIERLSRNTDGKLVFAE